MVSETKIRPQNILLKVATSELAPSYNGMLWVDSNNILRLDVVGTGNPNDFATVLPEHTVSGQHGPRVNITQTAADNALVINKAGLGEAVSITTFATNAFGIYLASAKYGYYTTITGDSGYGIKADIVGDSVGMYLQKTNTGGQNVLVIDNYGTGNGATIFNRGTAGVGLYVGNTGTGFGIAVNQYNGGSAGIYVNQLGNSIGCEIHKSGTSGGAALFIENQGTGNGATINQNGDAVALNINRTVTASTTLVNIQNRGPGIAIWADQTGNGKVMRLSKTGTDNDDVVAIVNNSGSGDTLELWQYGPGVCLNVKKSNTGIGEALLVENSGSDIGIRLYQRGTLGQGIRISLTSTANINSSLLIDNSGSANAINIQHQNVASTSSAINIDNSSAGKDIDGSNWWVDKNGNASFASVAVPYVNSMPTSVWGAWNGTYRPTTTTYIFPTGTWSVQVHVQFHSSILYEFRLYMDGALVMTLPSHGDTSGTDWVHLFGARTISGGSRTFELRAYGNPAVDDPILWMITALKVGA